MKHNKRGFAKKSSAKAKKGKPFRNAGSGREKDGISPRPGKNRPARSKQGARRRDDTKTWRRDKTKAVRPAPSPKETHHDVPRKGVLLWGIHAVHQAWLNPQRTCFNLWLTEAGKASMAGALAAATLEEWKRPSPLIVDRSEIDRLLPPNSVHQGVALEAAPLPDPVLQSVIQSDNRPDLVIVLDQVTDPHNVGAILRSAAAFGAGAVIMTDRNAPSTTGVLAKTASGAIEHVPLVHVTNLSRALGELQDAGYWCVGLAEDAHRHLGEIDLTAPAAIVLGNEGEGMRRLTRETCDELARLPTGGAIGTLNVSNAAAVALYEARKQKAKFG